MHKPNFTAQLTDKQKLTHIAAELGCTHTRGRENGTGSIRVMLEKIAAGELKVIKSDSPR